MLTSDIYIFFKFSIDLCFKIASRHFFFLISNSDRFDSAPRHLLSHPRCFFPARRRGAAGFASGHSSNHRGPASWHVLHVRPQHPLRQFFSSHRPRRLPLEPGRRRGGVGLLRHLRSGRFTEELKEAEIFKGMPLIRAEHTL